MLRKLVIFGLGISLLAVNFCVVCFLGDLLGPALTGVIIFSALAGLLIMLLSAILLLE